MRTSWIGGHAASKVSAPVADNAGRSNSQGFHEDASIFGLRPARNPGRHGGNRRGHSVPANFHGQLMATNGSSLYVRVGGHGPAVVLLHGFLGPFDQTA